MKSIKIIEVKSDIGAGIPGASLAIDEIKKIASEIGSDFFKCYESFEIKNISEKEKDNDYFVCAKNIKDTLNISENIAKHVKNILEEENFPLVISGDHSSAIGAIAGIKMADKNKRVGVVWIDAHADLHSPYTTPSGNMHGMPVLASLGIDNFEMKVRDINEEIFNEWEKIKNIGGIFPKINFEDLFYVGLRDYEEQEKRLIDKYNLPVITSREITDFGTEKVVDKILKTLSNCDYIYISFDVDSLDPSVSCGTGISIPNGLKEIEATEIILGLIKSEKICCFEITEVNPMLDKDKPMAKVAFNLLEKVAAQLNKGF
ncbi:MAG: arginase [Candidatus Nomurabacteria bacterium]